MKKILLLAIVFSILALVGCSSSNNSQTPPDGVSESDAATGTTSSPATTEKTDSSNGSNEIIYENTKYGFTFDLPTSWQGYTIVTDEWQGTEAGSSETVQTGTELSIRHPEWTKDSPRQDIPIMIFTIDQWDSLQNDEFHIGAAPTSPSELGRNSRYVFALPARYNFAFLSGYEEVEDILKADSLLPNENYE